MSKLLWPQPSAAWPVPPNALGFWTVYDHPRDFPQHYVVRVHYTLRGVPTPIATDYHFLCESLAPIRAHLEQLGLTCLPRERGDDEVILETWI